MNTQPTSPEIRSNQRFNRFTWIATVAFFVLALLWGLFGSGSQANTCPGPKAQSVSISEPPLHSALLSSQLVVVATPPNDSQATILAALWRSPSANVQSSRHFSGTMTFTVRNRVLCSVNFRSPYNYTACSYNRARYAGTSRAKIPVTVTYSGDAKNAPETGHGAFVVQAK
jgi:hypothetical protein